MVWRYLVCLGFCLASIGSAHGQSPSGIDWSGYHIGVLMGGTKSFSETEASVRDGSTYFSGNDFGDIKRAGTGDLAEWEWSGSLKGGYNWQFGNLFVGVEASADALLFDDARTTSSTFTDAPATRLTLRQQVKADWMATLRPRLGWAQDNWLAYVTAGPAVTRVTVETAYTDNFTFGGLTGASGRHSNTETKLGVTLGLGGEYALGQNWALSAQYLYADFGRVDTSTDVAHASAAAGRSTIDSSADLNSHSAMIGITYRFMGF